MRAIKFVLQHAKVTALAAVVLLGGCSAAAVHPAVHPTANQVACSDFAAQMTWIKNRSATLTLTDIAEFEAWVGEDAAHSTGKLASDFTALHTAMSTLDTKSDAKQQVERDCAHISN